MTPHLGSTADHSWDPKDLRAFEEIFEIPRDDEPELIAKFPETRLSLEKRASRSQVPHVKGGCVPPQNFDSNTSGLRRIQFLFHRKKIWQVQIWRSSRYFKFVLNHFFRCDLTQPPAVWHVHHVPDRYHVLFWNQYGQQVLCPRILAHARAVTQNSNRKTGY